MRVEVKFVHLVVIFAKDYQCEQGGQIFAPKTFPTFRLLRNLAIYIAVLRKFSGSSVRLKALRMSNACDR